jgi:hypothetical protein
MTGLAEEVISDRDIQGIYKALFNNLLANPLRASWLELDKPIYAASILVQFTHDHTLLFSRLPDTFVPIFPI